MNKKVRDITSPIYDLEATDMVKFRYTLDGGTDYVKKYLVKLSSKESDTDFEERKKIAHCPALAEAALQEICDAINSKMADIVRINNQSPSYNQILSSPLGVDRRGSTLNSFLITQVLPELLAMKRVGVFIDREAEAASLSNTRPPYMYVYKAEDIRSWKYNTSGELESLLLRRTNYSTDQETGLPDAKQTEFLLFKLANSSVSLTIYTYDASNTEVSVSKTLQLTRIPFVIFELRQSLFKSIADIQKALLNYESTDIALMRANFPFLAIQENLADMRSRSHYKNIPIPPNYTDGIPNWQDGTQNTNPKDDPGDQGITAGPSRGLKYATGMNAPVYVAPPVEPLEASLKKQRALKDEIRECVNLFLQSVKSVYQSDTSKQNIMSNGLVKIGSELERGERMIAAIYLDYDNKINDDAINSIKIVYPTDYDKLTDSTRCAIGKELISFSETVPSPHAQKLIQTKAVELVLSSFASPNDYKQIMEELNANNPS